jgi:xylulokinase
MRSSTPYVLGIDLGTSSVRALLARLDGQGLTAARHPYPLLMPKAGWAEQDPETWWLATKLSVREVLAVAGVGPEEVIGIGLSGQMHGLVVMDGNGHAIRPAIVWLDKRSSSQCLELDSKIGRGDLYRLTGMRAASGIYGSSLLWLKENEPDVYKKAQVALFPKDYIRFRLTGHLGSEPTDASGSLLFDIRRRTWATSLIERIGIRHEMLPKMNEPTAIAGELITAVAHELGLAPGTPVAVGGGDQAMGVIGSGLDAPDQVVCAIGTGGQVVAVLDKPIVEPELGLQVMCHVVPSQWLLMGATLSAGLALRWFRSTFTSDSSRDGALPEGDTDHTYELFSKEVEEVAAGSDGLLFLPHLAGERASDQDLPAKGCFIGMDISHRREHFVRSIMEGVAFSMKDILLVLSRLGVPISSVIVSGGGAKSPAWRSIQADVYGLNVIVTHHDEHCALGAAITAGVAAGFFADVSEARGRLMGTPTVVSPNPDNVKLYQARYAVYRSLYPALQEAAW